MHRLRTATTALPSKGAASTKNFEIPTRAASLLDRYTAQEGFFFGSQRCTWLAGQADDAIVGFIADGSLAHQAREALRPQRPASWLLAGALPFDPNTASALQVYQDAVFGPALRVGIESHAASTSSVIAIEHAPSQADYLNGVKGLVARIRSGELEKAVLSRRLDIRCKQAPHPATVLRRLAQQNPSAMCFAARYENDDQVRHFLGASPELLIARRGRSVLAHPMAGSLPRSADPRVDGQRAQLLVQSAKDLHEHAFVVSAVSAALAPLCDVLDVPDQPSLIATPTMWHLATRVRGQLRNPETTSIDLVSALHPTPAVCGTPREAAKQALLAYEGFERGLFGGAVGYCECNGDGEWAVSIRCAECTIDRVTLFAGAGVVADSDPAIEFHETAAKLKTMLRALGLEADYDG